MTSRDESAPVSAWSDHRKAVRRLGICTSGGLGRGGRCRRAGRLGGGRGGEARRGGGVASGGLVWGRADVVGVALLGNEALAGELLLGVARGGRGDVELGGEAGV